MATIQELEQKRNELFQQEHEVGERIRNKKGELSEKHEELKQACQDFLNACTEYEDAHAAYSDYGRRNGRELSDLWQEYREAPSIDMMSIMRDKINEARRRYNAEYEEKFKGKLNDYAMRDSRNNLSEALAGYKTLSDDMNTLRADESKITKELWGIFDDEIEEEDAE